MTDVDNLYGEDIAPQTPITVYTNPITDAALLSPLAAGDILAAARPGVHVNYKTTVDDAKTYAAPGFNVQQYGATGDGSTDDTAAINAAIAALRATGTGGTLGSGIIYFPSGHYRVTDTINMRDLYCVKIEATGAIIEPKGGSDFTNKAVVDAAGLLYSIVEGLRIICHLAANLPAAGLVVGRTAISMSGSCTFINCKVEGKYSYASVYDIATEDNGYYDCYFQSETSKPAYFTSIFDYANLVDIESTNCRKHFSNCIFFNIDNTGCVAIALYDGCWELNFDHCLYYVGLNGIVFDVVGSGSGATQGLELNEGRVEGAGGANTLLMRISGVAFTYNKIYNITWEIASTYIISTSKTIQYCDLSFGYSLSTYYIHQTAETMTNNFLRGFYNGALVIDAPASAYRNICTWIGYPFSGPGQYVYNGFSGNTNMIFSVSDSSQPDQSYALLPSRMTGDILFSDGDATPSVRGYEVCKTSNSNPTSITDFDNPIANQFITVLFGDAVTTIVHGAKIKLASSISITPSTGSTMTFYWDAIGSIWRETSRAIA